MKSNFHLLFYIRKQKNYKGGAMPIYMCITVNGKRVDMSAGRDCEPAKWNSHAGQATGTRAEIKSLNNCPDSLQTKLRNAHLTLIDTNKLITAESLHNQFTGKNQKSHFLMQLFKEHNTKAKALIGNEF
ncbi:Arm DNA-binding domain-containing protein [Mucilaginibacter sp.]|uniref:Arm DNA-binding domain-containing protein n=1 Tax=Mucilaginibacter sp. TaxID=1882438 RepID=UPI00283F2C6D|nr:Arm DNA-binding domain-containing protein [Mucilaginibacter sp.]MDR3694792.1 Arm DNA-binding domain-containing protein [Mucilaginibacter sp.]